MILISPSFKEGEMIPKKFTCDGGGINPELQVQNVPPDAKSLALVLHDPDAPRPGGFLHWIVWDIDPKTTTIKEESVPPGSVEGKNDGGREGYMGPCPSQGVHHYHFKLYALGTRLGLPPTATLEDLEREIKNHFLAEANLVGVYGTL